MCMCVCIQISESIRSEYIREERHSREKEIFAVSLFYHIARILYPFFASAARRPRLSVSSSRARPDECKSSTTALWTTFAVRLIIPALPVRARPSCNPCQLRAATPSHSTPSPARGRRGIDIYEGSLTYAGTFFLIGSLLPQYPSH